MPTRILFTADSQIDERHRLDEHDRVMDFIADQAQHLHATTVLHGGDIYERRSTERERRSVFGWVERIASTCDLVICGGNHEAAGEVEEIEAQAIGEGVGDVYADEQPFVRLVGPDNARVVIATLPWPRRENLRAWLARSGIAMGPEETSRTAVEMLRDILRDFARRFDEMDPSGKLPRILLCHVEIAGYVSDSDQPAVGSGMAVSVEDLMLAGADVVLCGHIHRPQEWIGTRADGVSVPVIYAGSPRRTAYAAGELIEKGFVVVEFDGRVPKWHRVATPATPMILTVADWQHVESLGAPRLVFRAGEGLLDHEVPKDAEIRLRYHVPSDQRDAARAAAEDFRVLWLAAGAADVVVEECVLPLTSARAPEVAAAESLDAQVRVALGVQSVPKERHDAIVAIVARCEEAVR